MLLLTSSMMMTRAAQADVMYQCIDDQGHKTFSNVKLSSKATRCTPMDLGPATAMPPPPRSAVASPSPSSFPKVGETVQKDRDNDRRRILENELAAEQKNLEQAKKELAEQEAIRTGDERNYQRVLDRLEPFKNKIALHERNIEAIQKEIAKLR
jgi:septal ring factor EnvC (AmiA/AmiB activator)